MRMSGRSIGAGLLVLGTLLTGCTGAPPMADHVYLLRPDVTVTATEGAPLRLKSVRIPPYLDQRGLVLQTGPSEIEVAKHHRWAEPLDGALERYLQVAIARRSGRPVETAPLSRPETGAEGPETIAVRIHQLHGTESGHVRLVADWRITGEGEPEMHSFDETRTQSADGYPALVAAHAGLLDALAGAIVDSLD